MLPAPEILQPHLEIVPRNKLKADPLFDTLSLVIQAEQAVRKVVEKSPLLKILKPLKNQPVDAIEGYFRRFFKTKENEWQIKQARTDQERASILIPDFAHTIWEMIQAKKETTFTIELDKENGYGDGYQESMDWQLANFVKLIEQQGLLASRGFLEQILFGRVYNQLFEIAQNHVGKLENNQTKTLYPSLAILVTSPPDSFAAGYHGADSLHNWNTPETHHSFHFVYLIDKIQTKRENGKLVITNVSVKTTQFRTWHNIQGLIDLHQRLGAPLQIDKQFPVTNQILANSIAFPFPEGTSQQDILDYFRKELYQGEKKWARNTQQAPDFSPENEQRFWKEVGLVSLEEFQQSNNQSLFHTIYLQPVLQLLKNVSDDQIQDPKIYQQLHDQIELRTQVFLQAVELRVRELNINPDYTKLVRNNLLKSIFKTPLQSPIILQQLKELSKQKETLPLNDESRLQTIIQLHQLIEQQQIFKQKLTKEQKKRLSANFGSVFAAGNFAFGSMQCYTIGSLQLPMKMAELNVGGNLSPAFVEALRQVDTETKKQLLSDLKSANYVELNLPGASRIWMVPASYLAKPGCRVDENGMVCGPCITEDFPLGIPFDHPLEQANPLGPLPMDNIKYQYYLNQLKENILQDQLEDQLQFDQLSDEDQTQAKGLIKRLTRTLFKVNLSNLIAGIDEHQDTAYKLPPEKLRKITNIEALEKLVIELESSDDETSHSELEEITETLQAA